MTALFLCVVRICFSVNLLVAVLVVDLSESDFFLFFAILIYVSAKNDNRFAIVELFTLQLKCLHPPGFSAPRYWNGKNNCLRDSELDQSILEMNVTNERIAFWGVLILKKVPTVALSDLFVWLSSGTVSVFSESIKVVTSLIK